jgi:hypothetical protein
MPRTIAVALALALAGAPVSAQWQTIEPGGETICSDGSPFRFFVHPGDPARLLVEFEGGGGCWSAETCAADIYTRRVTSDPELARRLGLLVGIYDRSNPENPFREWTHVYVPYCTGDLHWGNATRAYSSGLGAPLLVHHKGAVNAGSALAWTFANVAAPSQVAVVGCSAGGYGSILWAPHVIARYPGAQAVQLSDSAAGVVPPGFFGTVLASWDVSAAWPKDIPSLALDALDPAQVGLPTLYGGIAGHHPLATFSQYNVILDTTQIFFAGLTYGRVVAPAEWSAQMQASVDAIGGANPNFASYVAPGSQHCILNSPALYATSVSRVRLVDWINGLLSGNRQTVR